MYYIYICMWSLVFLIQRPFGKKNRIVHIFKTNNILLWYTAKSCGFVGPMQLCNLICCMRFKYNVFCCVCSIFFIQWMLPMWPKAIMWFNLLYALQVQCILLCMFHFFSFNEWYLCESNLCEWNGKTNEWLIISFSLS